MLRLPYDYPMNCRMSLLFLSELDGQPNRQVNSLPPYCHRPVEWREKTTATGKWRSSRGLPFDVFLDPVTHLFRHFCFHDFSTEDLQAF